MARWLFGFGGDRAVEGEAGEAAPGGTEPDARATALCEVNTGSHLGSTMVVARRDPHADTRELRGCSADHFPFGWENFMV